MKGMFEFKIKGSISYVILHKDCKLNVYSNNILKFLDCLKIANKVLNVSFVN